MKINATLPFDRSDAAEEFFHMDAVREVGRTLEESGFAGGNVTDHPCPTARWLDAGGHDAQDPFVMLSLVASVTTRLRLQTGILVLPYRNPFVVARAAATLDVFSGGRVTLGIGAGYLKGEYKALGVDFERRNELMDESLRAMKAAWTGENFSFEGEGFNARENRLRPTPVQRPHPPILAGGNSRRAIRRAVDLADGWYPFFTPAALSSTARTASISDEQELAEAISYMHDYCAKVRREQPPEIFVASVTRPGQPWEPQAIVDKLGRLAELGATGAATHIDGRDRAEWCDNARRMGTDVIAKLD